HSGLPMVGASGAIAGVSGAYLLFFPTSRVVTLVPIFLFVQVVEVPAVFFLSVLVCLAFVLGGAAPGGRLGVGGRRFLGAVGGFLAGMVLAPALRERAAPSGWA